MTESVNRAHSGRTIYVQTIFDTATLLRSYGKSENCNAPTGLSHPSSDPNFKTWVYMLTNWLDQLSGQASGNLDVQAKVNDTINWRSNSLSSNTGDSAVIYKITTDTDGVISTPRIQLTSPTVTLPKASLQDETVWPCPCASQDAPVTDFFWQSTVRKTGGTAVAAS